MAQSRRHMHLAGIHSIQQPLTRSRRWKWLCAKRRQPGDQAGSLGHVKKSTAENGHWRPITTGLRPSRSLSETNHHSRLDLTRSLHRWVPWLPATRFSASHRRLPPPRNSEGYMTARLTSEEMPTKRERVSGMRDKPAESHTSQPWPMQRQSHANVIVPGLFNSSHRPRQHSRCHMLDSRGSIPSFQWKRHRETVPTADACLQVS